jgi:hypothetical protein
MRLRHRPSVAKDFAAWLPHSSVRDRYGELWGRLPDIWASLLANGSALSEVVEDLDALKRGPVAMGVSVFLTDEFVREVSTPPLFWIGPELIRRIDRNESPVLDLDGIRAANSGSGLNLFVWEADIWAQSDADFLSGASELIASFFDTHAGLKINTAVAQQPFGRVFRAAVQIGGWLVQNEKGEYAPAEDPDAIERIGEPFILGMTRQLAQKNAGCWLATLFDYRPPVLFLTPAEQRQLTCALREWTDEEIAKGLAISTSAVKKCWQSIYTRAGLRLPALLPDDDDSGKRGAEKKRHLLSYVRSHPEELRPLLLKAQ